ncbi:MAG: glycosyltransferase [Ferruginibacter sp.]|nr:glycosyltransferase [Ferruginibacter sp.]NOU38846.1 glycosyltransferase [Ferruginibacter sp.]
MDLFKEIKFYLKKNRLIRKLQIKKVISTFNEKNNILQKELFFNTSATPKVSIIIPFYNQLNFTYNCLNYLYKHVGTKYEYEIILIDDNSTDNIDLSFYEGIRLIKNIENIGFLKSINEGIKESAGEFIYILQSNTEVQSEFLDELFFVFNNFSNVGAVGSKLINTNGALQEAGSVFLKNCNQIFTNKESFYPEVNYIKKVDYCTSISLLFKKYDVDGNINLFDEQFTNTHFEDADFCFQLKHLQNKNIYYTPFSEVIHFKELTYNNHKNNIYVENKKSEILFKVNLQKFKKKWQSQLDAIQATNIETRLEELYNNKSIVFFVGIIPPYDKDSGSNRLKEIIQAFINLGYHISILKEKTFLEESDYINYYQRLGVNVFYEHNKTIKLKNYLSNNFCETNIAWFYNPDSFSNYYALAKMHLHKAKFVFDMVDIHHLRYKRAIEFDLKNKKLEAEFLKYKKIELDAAQKADFVIPISDFEKKYMQQFCNPQKLITISNIHYIKTKLCNTLSFEERKDILFIGSTHAPNLDALHFLHKDIMPLVWKTLPNVKVNIIGNVSEIIKNIEHPNFIFHGFVENINPFFISNKLMVAPLRYGAGVKGKIGQAFEYYLPVVMTSIGAEGMQLVNGENALINDEAESFAKAIINLYSNKPLWIKLQSNSEKSLLPFSKEKLEEQLLKII